MYFYYKVEEGFRVCVLLSAELYKDNTEMRVRLKNHADALIVQSAI